jgi:1-phosphofructokinase/tagatose 6-phosphate kinase
MGAQNVIITMPDGCFARVKHGRRIRVYHASIPLIETVVSTVGSGDAFLAGFIASRFQRTEVPDCLRFGLACGAANTLRYGAGVFDPNEVERLYKTTAVSEVLAVARD